jgi:hypothetical protein
MRRTVVSAAVAMLLSCNTTQRTQAIGTDVCEVSKSSEAFHGKVVTLRAAVLSDLVERTFLISADCPSETVAIAVAADAEGGESLKHAIVDVMPDGTITATFIGTFEWRPNDMPARVLNVRAVHDLVAKK